MPDLSLASQPPPQRALVRALHIFFACSTCHPFVLWALAVIQPALFQRGSHRIAQIRHVRVWIRALEGVTAGSVSPSAASFAPDRGLLVIDQLGLHTLHGNTRRGRRVALQPDYL
jgi:hypothetical protein